jgi:hypothetical protein
VLGGMWGTAMKHPDASCHQDLFQMKRFMSSVRSPEHASGLKSGLSAV